MPFFEPVKNTKVTIDYDRYQPVSVISCIESDGKVTPIRFKYAEKDETRVTVNINEIRNRKAVKDGLSFTCLVTAYGRQKLVTLIFYTEVLIWVMPRIS